MPRQPNANLQRPEPSAITAPKGLSLELLRKPEGAPNYDTFSIDLSCLDALNERPVTPRTDLLFKCSAKKPSYERLHEAFLCRLHFSF